MGSSENKISVNLRPKQASSAGKERVHEAFANLRDDQESFARFTRTWGHPTGHPILDQFDGPTVEYRSWLRNAWSGDRTAFNKIATQINQYIRSSLEFNKGQLELVVDDFVGMSFLLFLRDHSAGRTAICANPDCHSPYFIKKRRTQKYCEAGPCTETAQREYARNWWNRNKAHAKGRKKT